MMIAKVSELVRPLILKFKLVLQKGAMNLPRGSGAGSTSVEIFEEEMDV
jgi:hypothetical protein